MADHADVVARIKSELEARGVDLSGSCGAFEIVKRVAWELRGEGAGLRFKPGGSGCDWNGVHYASDIISYPDGINVDMLGDAGGANTPAWNPYPPDPNVVQYHRDAIDPGDTGGGTVTPPPPPPPVSDLEARIHNIELQNNSIERTVNQIYARQTEILNAINAVNGHIDSKIGDGVKQIIAAIPAVTAAGGGGIFNWLRGR